MLAARRGIHQHEAPVPRYSSPYRLVSGLAESGGLLVAPPCPRLGTMRQNTGVALAVIRGCRDGSPARRRYVKALENGVRPSPPRCYIDSMGRPHC